VGSHRREIVSSRIVCPALIVGALLFAASSTGPPVRTEPSLLTSTAGSVPACLTKWPACLPACLPVCAQREDCGAGAGLPGRADDGGPDVRDVQGAVLQTILRRSFRVGTKSFRVHH
jgi:hypothetical protein